MTVLEQLNEKLNSFEDACKIEGLDSKKVIPAFEFFPESERKAMQAHAKWSIVVKAANRIANEGKEYKPDFSSYDEDKYEIWWEYKSGSRGFRYGGCVRWRSGSGVGSRLCFISREVSKYVSENFHEIWNEYAL